MQIFWRNDALCLRPDNDIERQSLAVICQAQETTRSNDQRNAGNQSDTVKQPG